MTFIKRYSRTALTPGLMFTLAWGDFAYETSSRRTSEPAQDWRDAQRH